MLGGSDAPCYVCCLGPNETLIIETDLGRELRLSRRSVELLLGHFSSIPLGPRAALVRALADGTQRVRLTTLETVELREHTRSLLTWYPHGDRPDALIELYAALAVSP